MFCLSLFLPPFFVAILPAQAAATNFSGDWNLNLSKSEMGPVPAPEMMTRKIEQADPAIKIETHQKGARGDSTSDLSYTTDGKPFTNKVNGSDVKGIAKWDGDSLVVDSTRDFQGTELKQQEKWTLSDGGKTLTINNHITLPNGEFDIKMVFDKQ